MPSTTIALSRVVELNVPLLWQEVVAVARACGRLAVQSGQPISLEGFAVSADGTVMAIGSSQGQAATDVYGLVAALLQGQPSPAELRALIASRDGATPGRGLSPGMELSPAFRQVEALDYFSTPNPEVDIAALAARALEAEADDLARGAIERLRTDAAPPVPPVPDRRDAGSRPARSKVLIGCTIALTLALAAAAAIRYSTVFMPAPVVDGSHPAGVPIRAGALVAETLSAAVQSMTSTLDAATDAALQKMGLVAASEGSAASAPAVRTADAGRRGRAPATRTGLPPPPISGPVVPRDMEIAPAAALVGDGTEAVPSPGAPEPDIAEADLGRVYSSSDVQVAPPSLVYPQLPTLPLDTGPETTHLSLVVDELGNVVQARLVSTGATIGSRMLVFAAKAWRFSPATVDGRSVKYLLRVPVEP